MKTKPRGIWANFRTTCTCGGELTISNGKVDFHQCSTVRPLTLADIRIALDGRQAGGA